MRVAAITIVGFVVSGATAADPPPNAALQYWQAFALMPDRRELSKAEYDRHELLLNEWPLDATTEKYLDRFSRAFGHFHRGAAIAECRWGSEDDRRTDGVLAILPQIGRAYTLRDTLLLRARYRFAHGEQGRAADDLLALARFARHLEPGGGVSGVLFSWNTESRAADALAAHLGRVAADQELLARVRREWSRVRPPRSLRAALDDDRDSMIGMFRGHAKIDPNNLPPTALGAPIPAPGTVAYFLGLQDWPDAVRDFCASYHRLEARWATLADVAPSEVDVAEKRMDDRWLKDTAGEEQFAVFVSLKFRPAVARLRKTECRAIAHRAMLRVALDIAAGGDNAVKGHRDPFDTGPFQLTRGPNGYELSSALGRAIGEPVVLAVRTAAP